MSVAESIIQKLQPLLPKKQEQVLLYVESLRATPSEAQGERDELDPHPWINVALSLNLDGPPDWSEKFEDYLNRDLGEAGH